MSRDAGFPILDGLRVLVDGDTVQFYDIETDEQVMTVETGGVLSLTALTGSVLAGRLKWAREGKL